MFHFAPFQVIRRTGRFGGDTGIICEFVGTRARVMFETANRGVEFRWYSVTALYNYAVIG